MPIAAAAPYIATGAAAIGGSLFGKKSVQGDLQRSPEEKAGMAGQTGAANALSGQAGQLSRMGLPALQQSGKYFSTLASGNRSAMGQALAPQIEATNDVYGGTARTLGRFLRGPEKDLQLAETERERAGGVASLFRNGRSSAAGALAAFGSGLTGQAGQQQSAAGSIFGQQAALGQANRYQGAELEHQAGSDFGGLMFNLLKMYANKGQGAGA